MQISAILLAAGKGKRLGSSIPKPLVKIGAMPLIAYSLKALNSFKGIKEIIVVANSANEKSIRQVIRSYKINKAVKVVKGSLRRQDSLGCGLKALGPKTELVLIHDAARPFICREVIASCVKAASLDGAAVAAVPVKATIKQAKGLYVKKTLEREGLWEVQTPQVFKKDIILKAYRRFGKIGVTDDASLVEKMGKRVRISPGSYLNIKITTAEDVLFARLIAGEKWIIG